MRGHIVKRGIRYYIVVDIGRDHKNNRKQKWFSGYTSRKSAEDDLPLILTKMRNGYKEPEDVTYKEYLLEWLRKKRQDVAYGTYKHYKSYINNHIIPGLGMWKIKALDYDLVDYYVDELKDNPNLSQQTKIHIYRILSTTLKDGRRNGIKQGIMDDIQAPKKERREIEYWTLDEIRSFTSHLKSKNHRLPIMLALATGMRYGEVAGLRWSKVDFNNQSISVTHQLKIDEIDGKPEWVISPVLKTETSYRTIKLDDDTVKMLKDHKQQQEKNKLKVGEDYYPHDLVCATTIGDSIKPTYLRTVMKRTCDRSGVKLISFHGLRHTHATLLLSDGVHPKIVQERLGHRSIETTLDTYSHVVPGMQEMAATSIQKSLHSVPLKKQNKTTLNNVVSFTRR